MFQAHGHRDELVLYEWGKRTKERLSGLGVNIVFNEYPLLYHQLSPKQMNDLQQWLAKQLPSDL